MTGKTHLACGAMASAGAAILLRPIEGSLILALAAGIAGSAFPDIDHPNSIISKKLKMGGKIIPFFFSHRGIFHTPFLYAMIGLLLLLFHPSASIQTYLTFFMIGAGSHILLDLLNPGGIPVFYPITKKKHSLLHIPSSGIADKVLRYLFIASTIFLFFI